MPAITASSVDLFVFRREGVQLLYLLLRGAPATRFAGVWHVLSGELTASEPPMSAAVRLLSEKTGLAPIQLWCLDYLHNYYDPLEDRIHLNPVFVAEVEVGQVFPSATIDASRWITYDQAIELLRLPGHREGLRRVHDDIAAVRDRGAPFRVFPPR